MSTNTGFMDYKRQENACFDPLKRIDNFLEFHDYLDENARKEQAMRCMNCGVAMCQSAIVLNNMVTGCPLHNCIPEFNDALSKGQYEIALRRLLKTSSFPEFTARVCPALCEKACNCGNPLYSNESVSIHDNELFIIEKAFELGLMKPKAPKTRSGKKVAIIGSGPSGLAVADYLNKRGHSVCVYEREDRAGGLLMYGIPNMKLDKDIVLRRIKLMEEEGVKFIYNADVGHNYSQNRILNDYDAIALCCGAKKPRALSAKGLENVESGIMYAVDFLKMVTKSVASLHEAQKTFSDDLVITNRNVAFSLAKKGLNIENKHVIIVGGGDTGNDCTGTSIRLGCASVTQLEMLSRPPVKRDESNPWPQWPKVLKTDYGAEEAIAKFNQDPRIYETTIKEVISDNGKVIAVKTVEVEFKDKKLVERENTEKILPADLILIAAGFIGCEDYSANAFDVSLTQRGTVKTLENSYQTEDKKIFCAGDMHRGQSLVVWAIAEGRNCAKEIDKFLFS